MRVHQTVTRDQVTAAIHLTAELRDHPTLARNGFLTVQLERDHNRWFTRQIIALEGERVLATINYALLTHLTEGSICQFANPNDDEFWFVATAGYHVAAGRFVEALVADEFSRERSLRESRRPFFVSVTRFNVDGPLSVAKKTWFMSNFIFRFHADPSSTALPPHFV